MSEGRKDDWCAGEVAHYEYHCNRAHDSDDAELWYRSHRTTRVMGTGETGIGDTLDERIDAGEVRTYCIRFDDGHESEAFEDELFDGPDHLNPDMGPPTDDDIIAAGGTVPPRQGETT